MNEELKQAVEKAAEQHSIRKDNETEAQDGFIAGAEFMFSLLNKPSENAKLVILDDGNKKDKWEAYSKNELRDLLSSVIDELDLSDEMIEKHGPLGTEPHKLVRLVLDEKDSIISALKHGFMLYSKEKPSSCRQENDSELLRAAERILHLHLCEQEGIGAGQPSPTDWMNAVDALSDAINNVKNKSK